MSAQPTGPPRFAPRNAFEARIATASATTAPIASATSPNRRIAVQMSDSTTSWPLAVSAASRTTPTHGTARSGAVTSVTSGPVETATISQARNARPHSRFAGTSRIDW